MHWVKGRKLQIFFMLAAVGIVGVTKTKAYDETMRSVAAHFDPAADAMKVGQNALETLHGEGYKEVRLGTAPRVRFCEAGEKYGIEFKAKKEGKDVYGVLCKKDDDDKGRIRDDLKAEDLFMMKAELAKQEEKAKFDAMKNRGKKSAEKPAASASAKTKTPGPGGPLKGSKAP